MKSKAIGVVVAVVALAMTGVAAAAVINGTPGDDTLRGTLGAMQELLDTTSDEMKETLPEVRETIGNVNDIAMGVNVGLRTAGRGAEALTKAGRLPFLLTNEFSGMAARRKLILA